MKKGINLFLFFFAIIYAGCGGGGGSSSTPTTTTSTSAATANANKSPVITSGPTPATSSISTASTTTVSVSASDPDSDELSYSWYASCGTISGTGSSVTFTAPSTTGTCTIFATAYDGKGGSASNYTSITASLQVQTDDEIEPNDTRATATPVTFGIWYNADLCASYCGDKIDYYKINTSSSAQKASVNMTNTDEALEFGVEVYDSSGKFIETDFKSAGLAKDNFHIFSVNPGSTYYVLIGNLSWRSYTPSRTGKYSVIFREKDS